MNGSRLETFRTRAPASSALTSSRLHPVARIIGVNTASRELSATLLRPSAATTVSLGRAAPARAVRTLSQPLIWARIGTALAVEGIAATRDIPERPAMAQPSRPAKAPPAIAKVELTIDSLGSYELNQPIPVFVESLGNRHFVAEVPDLNISTSAHSLSDILIVLKERVTQTYDALRIRKNLDAEQSRQLKVLETYIGRSRRSWLDRR
ncbi:MAG: hypothetical protein ACREE2_00270 [Stellaceae bacterium]